LILGKNGTGTKPQTPILEMFLFTYFSICAITTCAIFTGHPAFSETRKLLKQINQQQLFFGRNKFETAWVADSICNLDISFFLVAKY